MLDPTSAYNPPQQELFLMFKTGCCMTAYRNVL
jgi:hypothetical protein